MHEFRSQGPLAAHVRGAGIALLVVLGACATFGGEKQPHFASPQKAVSALLDALERDDPDALVDVLGAAYRDRIVTAQWDAESEARREIWQAAKQGYKLRSVSRGEMELIVGAEEWPFPVPIVRDDAGWTFDVESGLEELTRRRIGANELTAIRLLYAYADAQIEYALVDRNGDGRLEYAQRLSSTPGQRDGLYWPTSDGEPSSPFGPLVTRAERLLGSIEPGEPIRGYYFRILTRQGDGPPGGRHDYVVNGRMITGFALVAFPAEYDVTGSMTFVVSQRGVVYEKDLGEAGERSEEYAPDDSWSAVAE